MIEERITGNRNNVLWKRRRLLEDKMINIQRISGIYPDRDKEGSYFMFVKYFRVIKKPMQKGKKGKNTSNGKGCSDTLKCKEIPP